MKKKTLSLILASAMVVSLAACGNSNTPADSPAPAPENTPAETTPADNAQESTAENNQEDMSPDNSSEQADAPTDDTVSVEGKIALVTDVGTIDDESFNQATWEGVVAYGDAHKIEYTYYQPTEDSTEERINQIDLAVSEGATVIVLPGYLFGETLSEVQTTYPDVNFIAVDVSEGDMTAPIESNAYACTFSEEQAGYLAGYMAVWEGYRNLGFIGGREEPAVQRYGYGYLQGINAAAKDLSLTDVAVNYWYAGTYTADIAVREKADEWYGNGTQIIFACGGGLYESVLEAAENQDGLMIGVDVDQCRVSDRVLTSAVKNIGSAVTDALDEYYAAGGWSDEDAGQVKRYGVEEGCAAIPVVDTEWRFQEIPTTHFFEIYKQMKRGDRTVSDATDMLPEVAVLVNYE